MSEDIENLNRDFINESMYTVVDRAKGILVQLGISLLLHLIVGKQKM